MREIKFRAWNGTHILEWDWLEAMGFISRLLTNEYGKTHNIMQYTGLKDKNGKEAYHKDILKDDVLGELWLIEWSDKYACFELQRITENTVKVKGILETISACRIVDFGEIIGNIYENPELLKA